jgi:hemerythrin-like domain-containing protein
MQPTEVLIKEHEIISLMLEVSEKEAQHILDGKKFDPGKIEKLIDFFRNFADSCHHVKEEKYLFVKLIEKGMSAYSGPISIMNFEHLTCRKLVNDITEIMPSAKSGYKASIRKIAEILQAYVTLIKSHIYRENNILFPMADNLLNEEDQKFVSAQFDEVEKIVKGMDMYDKYRKMVMELVNSKD